MAASQVNGKLQAILGNDAFLRRFPTQRPEAGWQTLQLADIRIGALIDVGQAGEIDQNAGNCQSPEFGSR